MSATPAAYATPRPTKYCHACGSVIDAAAVVCPYCGVGQPGVALRDAAAYELAVGDASEKRVLVGFLLCFFAGWLGLHRFYAGKVGTGVLQLVTFGGFGIWWLVDLVLLVTGKFRDADGRRMVEWT